MRLFYAFTFTNDSKLTISKYRDLIKDKSIKGKFMEQSNIHLTLEFIGEVKPDDVSIYKNILTNISSDKINLTVDTYGKFTKKNKDIVWLGIKPNNSVTDIVSAIDKQLLLHNLKDEVNEYIPHITLGRGIVFDGELEKYTFKPFDVPVISVALMESKRVDDKLVYSPIYELLL